MSRVTLPSSRIPLTLRGDVVSVEFYRWMHDITHRVGGVHGWGSDDLITSQPNGQPEQEEQLYALGTEVSQLPAIESRLAQLESDTNALADSLEELRGILVSILSRMSGLEQGTVQ